jgi:signal peptidase II
VSAGTRGRLPLALGVAVVVIAVDQLSKAWILYGLDLPAKGRVEVAPPVFNLTMVHNPGVSFGLLRADADVARWALVVFSVAVAVGLAAWARRAGRAFTGVALGLVIGGALGNVVDRARFGWVTDFLDFSGLHFPWVFNVADSGITTGVALLLLESLLPGSEPAPAAAVAKPPQESRP